jgi:hypothetical protein
MVYTSMILHNACTILKDDAVDFDVGNDADWQSFFTEFASHRCPSCKAKNVGHCPHDATNRNPGQWYKVVGEAHGQREQIKNYLWDRDVVEGEVPTLTSDYRI